MRKLIFTFIFALIAGTACASLIIKGQIQVKNLNVNNSSSGGGSGSPTGAFELEQSEGLMELEQSEGVLLYE